MGDRCGPVWGWYHTINIDSTVGYFSTREKAAESIMSIHGVFSLSVDIWYMYRYIHNDTGNNRCILFCTLTIIMSWFHVIIWLGQVRTDLDSKRRTQHMCFDPFVKLSTPFFLALQLHTQPSIRNKQGIFLPSPSPSPSLNPLRSRNFACVCYLSGRKLQWKSERTLHVPQWTKHHNWISA